MPGQEDAEIPDAGVFTTATIDKGAILAIYCGVVREEECILELTSSASELLNKRTYLLSFELSSDPLTDNDEGTRLVVDPYSRHGCMVRRLSSLRFGLFLMCPFC